MTIYQFPLVKAKRNLVTSEEGFRQLAIAKAERDFQMKTVHNGYNHDTQPKEWAAYDLRIKLLRGRV